MTTDNWNRILNPDETYKTAYGQSGNQVVTGGRNAFANYGAENAEKENVQFMFPGPTFTDIENRTHVMRRGFIRSIIFDPKIYDNYAKVGNYTRIAGAPANATGAAVPEAAEMSKGHHRVNFQFNPEYLERAVKQEMGTMNPLLQNPANLTQSVPGTAKFGFSLMFNRELEVQRGAIAGKKFEFNYEEPDFLEIYNSLDPERIGVLADLLLFDSIIGQGISPSTVEAINAFTNNIVNRANEVKTSVQAIDKDGKPIYDEDPNDPDVGIPRMVEVEGTTKFEPLTNNLNFGNSAFLNPLPVRIVFSDYFMVEGLITASTVGFQKFSKDLVPTVCTVNIAVDALYIGFAQRNAYLTKQLSDAAEADATTAQLDSVEVANAKTALTRYFNELTYLVNEPGTSLATMKATTQQTQNPIRQDHFLEIPPASPATSLFKYRFWKSRYPDATRTSVADLVSPQGDVVYPGWYPWTGQAAELQAYVSLPMWLLGCQSLNNISNTTGVPDMFRKKGWMKNDNLNNGYVPIQITFKNPSSFTNDTSYDWETTYNPGGTAPTFNVLNSEITVKYEDAAGIELPDKEVKGTIVISGDGIIKDQRQSTGRNAQGGSRVTQNLLVGTVLLGNEVQFAGGRLTENTIYKYSSDKKVFLKEIVISFSIQLAAKYKTAAGNTFDIVTSEDFIPIELRYEWDTPFVGKSVFRQTVQIKSTN
ncbi:hypothetical protein UFOVP361_47 [uncultured Caudovirales phage]|uniref:Uncharacterized protein n=1 Tax=uncultured Caudovirales phage TaxID=2100421 RepID=A0A6J7WWU9_9CAUD|nr:hypothetical protein UFOVP361_47 [uncultured Caudovirales phage]